MTLETWTAFVKKCLIDVRRIRRVNRRFKQQNFYWNSIDYEQNIHRNNRVVSNRIDDQIQWHLNRSEDRLLYLSFLNWNNTHCMKELNLKVVIDETDKNKKWNWIMQTRNYDFSIWKSFHWLFNHFIGSSRYWKVLHEFDRDIILQIKPFLFSFSWNCIFWKDNDQTFFCIRSS